MDPIIIERTVSLDTPLTVEAIPGTVFAGEALAHRFVIHGRRGGSAVDFAGTASGKALLADGTTVPLTGSVTNGAAVVTLSAACYAVPGRVVISLYVTSGSMTVCVYAAVANNRRTDSDTVVDPGTIIPSVTALIDALSEAQGAIVSAVEDSGVVTLTDVNNDTYAVPTNAAFTPVKTVANAISEEHPNIFCLGTVSTNKGVTVSADADGSLITFSGTSSNPPVTLPLFGQDDYSAAVLPAGTYFVGEEQVTGENRLNIRVGDTTVSNQIVTITEAKRCYLRFGSNGVSFAGCSARYWIIPLAAPVKFVPHSSASATDLVARAAAEALKAYIDEQIAGVMLAIGNT